MAITRDNGVEVLPLERCHFFSRWTASRLRQKGRQKHLNARTFLCPGQSPIWRAARIIRLRMLAPGFRFGPYEVVSLLGAGGMGEVYRARDTKLERDVALKILPAAFTSDADRAARFEREARLLASLNHPHIAAIYGFERCGEVPALVLELVDGDTLADRVRRGPVPLP